MTKSDKIHLLDQRVSLQQPEGGFRPGLDSVMLAAACPAKAGEHILDLGCGVGSAGLCVLIRIEKTKLTGIDIIEDLIGLANENAALNDLQDRTDFLPESVLKYNKGGKPTFDHIICNPPFLEAEAHSRSPDENRATAHGLDGEASLEDWLRCAFDNLKSGGSLTMIHRADMVDKIILGLGKSYGAIEIIPLWPKAGKPAKRVVIRAIKDRKSPAIINPGVVLHEEDGENTKAAENILRGAEAL